MGPTNTLKVHPCYGLPLARDRLHPQSASIIACCVRKNVLLMVLEQARVEAKGSVRALYGTDGGKNAAHGRSVNFLHKQHTRQARAPHERVLVYMCVYIYISVVFSALIAGRLNVHAVRSFISICVQCI